MKSPERICFEMDIQSLMDVLEGVSAERDSLKDQLFEARQALLKEGMQAELLRAQIEKGIRVQTEWYSDTGYVLNVDGNQPNATLILGDPP